MKAKGVITLEFVLCILIIIIILSFFVTVNIYLKEKLEESLARESKITSLKKEHYKENNWEIKDVTKKPESTSNDT